MSVPQKAGVSRRNGGGSFPTKLCKNGTKRPLPVFPKEGYAMNKKIIIRLLIIVWIIGCVFAIPYVCFMKKTTKNNNRYFEQLKKEAVIYMNQESPTLTPNTWEVYTLNTNDVDKSILIDNFFSSDTEYVYPYGITNIYLTNGRVNVVVIFEKTEDGKIVVTDHKLVEKSS